MQKCEILAPVGNKEMMIAAVRSGADAVYLGGKEFNARRNADNFGDLDLADAVKYCHAFEVKVYLTLNISIKENEVGRAVDLAVFAHNCGVDGVIITDWGLCEILHAVCPKLPLHASTQMTVHSVSALPTLKKLGVKRVVVSREMNKHDLKKFVTAAQDCGIETEVFVHGALCMSMSGQCLLSAMLGGRSGNRGLCAGPCRLPFKAQRGNGYDLSLKDLSLVDKITELKNMGVASLKIEGRMKRPEYVAAAVDTVRKSRDGENYAEDFARLQAVFSRSGFTDGYFENNLGKDMFGIRTKEDVTAANSAFPSIHEIYRTERQKLALSAKIEVKTGLPVALTLTYGEFSASVSAPPPQKAKTRALTSEDICRSISKLGSTPYFLQNAEIKLDDGLFLPTSALNNLRIDAINKLTDMRTAVPKHTIAQIPQKSPERLKRGQKIFCRFEENAQIPKNFEGIDGVIIPLENNPPPLPENILKIVELPRGIKNESAITERLKIFKENGFTYAAVGNIAEIELVKQADLKIFSSFSMNVFNSYSAEFSANCGAEFVTLSPELTLNEAKSVNSPVVSGIFAYGRLPLMLTANCPVKNGADCSSCDKKRTLTDRLGVEFPVRCRMGFSELLNSKPIFLADKLSALSDFEFLMLYFTDESPQITEKTIKAYCGIQEYKPNDYTRGLCFRGVE